LKTGIIHNLWRAALACPDEGVRAYVVRGAFLPNDIQSGTAENSCRFPLSLLDDPLRDAGIVIDRNNHLWSFVRTGFRRSGEHDHHRERN
jgi:hypothetical protein